MRGWRSAAALAVVGGTYALLLLPRSAVDWLTVEDHFAENVGFVAALLAGLLFLRGYVRRRDARGGASERLARPLMLLLAFAFIVLAGEEVAWGARMLGLGIGGAYDPTFHNQTGQVGDTLERGFKACWLLYAGVLPLIAAAWPALRRRLHGLVPLVPIWISLAVVVNQAARAVLGTSALRGHFFHPELGSVGLFPLDELWEMNFTVLAALAAGHMASPGGLADLRWPRRPALVAGAALLVAGVALIPGRFTPLALTVLLATYTVALTRVPQGARA